MCKGSTNLTMEQNKFGDFFKSSVLLELAAADDVSRFESEVRDNSMGLNDVGLWYGRNIGCKTKMGFEERNPFMVAALYGSINILKHIIGTQNVDVNKASESDGATALHCAVAGGSASSVEAVKLLLLAAVDPNLTDFNGNKPVDLIARGVKSSVRKCLVMLLNGLSIDEVEIEEAEIVVGKKEYPVDVSLPDINDGVYGTDEFRMFVFKVKPCSRAYSHDWTECPFVHPGENARRRDPRKHQYSCVPCLEFRKGSCVKGDNCEYAHGVFESWLHPAQYRTRLCKDETGCARKVCFFAHKVEELRPVYASTGSAVPSPKSSSAGLVETGSMSPLGIGSTPPMSPSIGPVNGNLWQNKFVHVTPPALQLSGSRLKTLLHARDLNMELQMLQRQQMIDDLSTNIYNNNMFGEMKPTKFDDVYGSPSRQQIRLDSSPLRSAYPSSPGRKPTNFGFDSSSAVAQAVMNTRSSSFAKQRSQSFIDRGLGSTMSPRSMAQSPAYSEWGSPDGKVDWGFKSEDANKFRKSSSFGYKSGNSGSPMKANHEPDDPWAAPGVYGSSEKVPQRVEQMYIEQEKLIA
ncbi:zinc finger CCCH domain-containing protein 29-like [Bidens hawaiensis]|uniref:zinc finger CCCH domain-containing protein 29-like n=1 Tax=Bidens hawaiensis TaxID=980011 RepID=UPI00404B505B